MLSGKSIEKEVNNGTIIIDPWNESRLNPNSYNLRLDSKLYIYPPQHVLNTRKKYNLEFMQCKEIPSQGYILKPGILYLGSTIEYAGSTKYIPCIEGRSSVARVGLSVHLSAGFGDIGFVGRWTLELSVVQPLRIYAGIEICQIMFYSIEGDYNLYNGRYPANQPGVLPSKGVL
jgi:dCTP deaminase